MPYIGYGSLRLGCSRRDLIDQLGKPDRTEYHAESGETGIEYYVYDAAGLNLGFTPELGDHLSVITIRSADATYQGDPVIGVEIESLMVRHTDIVLEDDLGEGGQEYVDELTELSLWVIDGFVDSVTIFPDWIDDVTPRWP